jgi:hypothetical protein
MEDADASRADEEAYDDEDDAPEKVSTSEEDIDACDDQNHSDEPQQSCHERRIPSEKANKPKRS